MAPRREDSPEGENDEDVLSTHPSMGPGPSATIQDSMAISCQPSESEKSSLLADGTKALWVFIGIEGFA